MVDNFKDKAQSWDKKQLRQQMANTFSDSIKKKISIAEIKSMLDFGCGTGLVGLQFVDLVDQIYMVDTSPAMISVLKEKIESNKYTNIQIHQSDLSTISLERPVDLIVSLMAFHHVHDIDSVLTKMFQVLNPQGKIIIGDLYTEDGSFHDNNDDIPHHGFNVDLFKKKCEKNGFVVDEVSTFNTIVKNDANGKLQYYDQFLLIAEKKIFSH